jgi:hypothetical protein
MGNSFSCSSPFVVKDDGMLSFQNAPARPNAPEWNLRCKIDVMIAAQLALDEKK